MTEDVLDEQEFYELMQTYRHASNTTAAFDFETVKRWLRKKCMVPVPFPK